MPFLEFCIAYLGSLLRYSLEIGAGYIFFLPPVWFKEEHTVGALESHAELVLIRLELFQDAVRGGAHGGSSLL